MKEEKITIGASRLPAFFRDVIHATGDTVDVRVTIENGMATIRKMAEATEPGAIAEQRSPTPDEAYELARRMILNPGVIDDETA